MTVGTKRATFGAQAFAGRAGKLPPLFPRLIGPDAMDLLAEVIQGGLAVDMTSRFEAAFAKTLGVRQCVAAPGCNMAMATLAMALKLDPGDEIVFSAISDYGTIAGFIHFGIIPVFADTAPGSVNVTAQTIEPCLTDRTRAICVVHKTGLMCDLDPILSLARSRGLLVIEDACQAVYSRYKGRLAGTIGDIGCFSFDAEKTMGADIGGCFITNDEPLAERARFLSTSRGAVVKEGFGRVHLEPGLAIRMPQCTAATCLAQLQTIQAHVNHIDQMARRITTGLSAIPGIVPTPIPAQQDIYSAWMIGLSLEPGAFRVDADTFGRDLVEAGIPDASTARYYHVPDASPFLEQYARAGRYPFLQPFTSRQHHYAGVCPNARAFLERWIRWSSFSERYTPADCDLAVELIADVAARHRR